MGHKHEYFINLFSCFNARVSEKYKVLKYLCVCVIQTLTNHQKKERILLKKIFESIFIQIPKG